MKARLTLFSRLLIAALVVGVPFGAYQVAKSKGWLGSSIEKAAAVPDKIDLPTGPVAASGQDPAASAAPQNPGAQSGKPADYQARILTIPWNTTMGLHYANGGPTTASGSLMAKHNVKLAVERQDDYAQMTAELAAFAKEYKDGNKYPRKGAAFAIIMGDGYAPFAAATNQALKPFGQSVEVVGALGYSRGEDKCMLPAEIKADPQKARGKTVAAVLRDGDWNICVKWAADNGIPINPDEKTFDPTAMNFIATSSFSEADEKYITGYCEQRQVVKAGKKTGEKTQVCVDGTATWTPGDVKVATKKGGIVAIASTEEYMWQMPSILIGNKQWMAENRAYVEALLAAAFEGGEAVRSDKAALMKAAEVEAQVYKEENAEYWSRYFTAQTIRDASGQNVRVGGSTTNGLGDQAFLFGLKGNDNLYKRVYNVFGNISKKYYPEVLPSYPAYEEVVNTSYIEALLARSTQVAQAVTPAYTETNKPTQTFAKRSWTIEFQSGKADFTADAVNTLNELLDQLSISGLAIQINGHTDNVGNQMSNLELSKRRADAVKQWIVTNAPSSFPSARVTTRGYGDTQPIADNHSENSRHRNRRVEVVMLGGS